MQQPSPKPNATTLQPGKKLFKQSTKCSKTKPLQPKQNSKPTITGIADRNLIRKEEEAQISP